MDVKLDIPPTPQVWARFALILSVVIAVAANLLFLIVSVFFVPGILAWKAAQPFALLALYIGLFTLTVLPFVSARYFYGIMSGKRPKAPTAKPLFIFAGLFLIPALILLPQIGSSPHILDRTADNVVLGIPGVLCIALSMLLIHRGIAIARRDR